MVDGNEHHRLKSTDFDWDLDRPEYSQEVLDKYDVRKAKEIIAATTRPVEFIDLKLLANFFKDDLEGVKLEINRDWNKVDTTFPVIFAQTKNGKLLIDGRHRMYKALEHNLDKIPAVYLTEDETASICTKL